MRQALKFLGAGVMVYVVVAACSSTAKNEVGASSGDAGLDSGGGALASGGASGSTGAAPGVGGANGGAQGVGGASGTGPAGGSGGGLLDAMADVATDVADALTDPVPDASAAPEAVTAQCDTQVTQGTTVYHFAIADFAGRSADELASTVVLFGVDDAPPLGTTHPPGYTWRVAPPSYIRDGEVAVVCRSRDQTDPYNGPSEARFVFMP